MNEKFKNMIKEAFELDQSFEIGSNDQFRDYDNWDSLTKLSLIASIDESYNMVIEEIDFKDLITINDLYIFLNNKS